MDPYLAAERSGSLFGFRFGSIFGYRYIQVQSRIQQGIDGPLFGFRKIRIHIWLQIDTDPDLATNIYGSRFSKGQMDPYLASDRYGSRFGFRQIRIHIWLQIDTDPYLASERYGPRFGFRYIRIRIWLHIYEQVQIQIRQEIDTDPYFASDIFRSGCLTLVNCKYLRQFLLIIKCVISPKKTIKCYKNDIICFSQIYIM